MTSQHHSSQTEETLLCNGVHNESRGTAPNDPQQGETNTASLASSGNGVGEGRPSTTSNEPRQECETNMPSDSLAGDGQNGTEGWASTAAHFSPDTPTLPPTSSSPQPNMPFGDVDDILDAWPQPPGT